MPVTHAPADFPLRHLSIRVPWHDSGWAGTVCKAPHLNGACVKLKRIAGHKKDADELPVAGESLETLPRDKWPCCVEERATFMAPFETEHVKKHALAEINAEHYGHFIPTSQRFPAYSAGIVPFNWMMSDNLDTYRDLLDLDVDAEREPDLGYETGWIHEAQNQTALLDGFTNHLKREDSLCFFYAKHVPFIEGTGRIIVAVGRIRDIGPLTEYRRKGDGMRGMVWERPIQHSIRPKGSDGFLVPYLEILQRAEKDPSLDLERYTAKAPDEHWAEFSYASELVTHDGAIGALLNVETVLQRMEDELGITTTDQRRWINEELVRLWKVRGPFPGLGAVLTAFKLSRGVFIAHALQQKAGENQDPWPLVDQAFAKPASVLPATLHTDLKELAKTWKGLPPDRRDFLKLLSRFELTQSQAQALYEAGSRNDQGWPATDREILANPYRIYEISQHDPEGVRLLTIDRGVFPEDTVRILHPLPSPSGLDSAADLRRVRAFCISVTEEAAKNGHTLLPKDKVVAAILAMPVRPACPATGDMIAARAEDMKPALAPVPVGDGDIALQLARYRDIAALSQTQIEGRVKGKRHVVDQKWAALLTKKFGASKDPEELRAREEKSAALKELAESRFSVLVGPAGAGKTTVLGFLCAQPEIQSGGLLLLAPTGKARVRMQQLAGGTSSKALTLAQFLNQHSRYDGRTGRYHLSSDHPKATGYGTIIVDEASMLTEDMLGALFDAVQGVHRFIFVGDPAQLPPIGAGRPFVDIIAKLRPADHDTRFPRVTPGYAELTIERRQVGNERPDLRFARWFSATPPSVGEDDVFSSDLDHATIRFVEWQRPDDFQQRLTEVLINELKLSGPTDFRGFNRALGAVAVGEYDYFNATRNGTPGSVSAVEQWQILSPLRGMPFGVGDINRLIHESFRAAFVNLATQRWRSIPKPFGAERVVYGDKVINLSNHRRDGKRVYPAEGALGYLANGEIGVAVGQWKSRGNPTILKIEFSSQPGYTYDFYGSDFREEGDPSLELAYALTVHKAQGSQFDLVIIVIPENHPILSRELIYTALTRHKDRVIVLHQGPRSALKDLAAPHRSETSRRMTNLLQPCRMMEFPQTKGSVFMQEGLVHRTSKGLAVRSKSELIIADALDRAGLNPVYEQALKLGGSVRYPDFTIEDDISGRTIYWEHLGMLDRKDYERAWTSKLAWYRANGVLPAEEGGGPSGMLVTSTETGGHFDAATVQELIRKYCRA